MTEAQKHRQKAEQFLRAYHATPDAHLECRVISLFYCAVHLVNMVGAHQGKRPFVNHGDREHYIRENHRKLWEHYMALRDLGWHARYICSPLGVNARDIDEHFCKVRLHAIRKWAEQHLGDAAKIGLEIVVRELLPSARPAEAAATG